MELSKYIKSESVELNRSAIHFADLLLQTARYHTERTWKGIV